MFFSIVVPTYGRPDEVAELLASLEAQQNKNFEVIIADGSPDNQVETVADNFRNRLDIKYLYRKGLGISEARNKGVENAKGDYNVFFDSDCIVPAEYFNVVLEFLSVNSLDAYGGPDRAGENFNSRQKAISYAMTSFFTTGGIRGRKNHAGSYQPRTFNMGIRKSVFEAVGGFSDLRVSEDIDLSLRLYKNNYRIGLIKDAYVYHKRRATFYKFFRQVYSFGSGRIDLQVRHGDALKPVHILPSLFVLYLAIGVMASMFSSGIIIFWLIPVTIYLAVVFLDALYLNRSLIVGILSIYAAFVMLTGYGLGMIKAAFMRFIIRSKKESEKPMITKGS